MATENDLLGITEVPRQIAEQLNRLLAAKSQQGGLINHNLEKGLGNEVILRELMESFLPRRYGIAKGKLINHNGALSKHLDLIVYDATLCPKLFVDENKNQILPSDGVFAVVEVKTTLTSTTLDEAFANLSSVAALGKRLDRSTNDFVTSCPPYLEVFAFSDNRSLQSLHDDYKRLSEKYPVARSAYSYAKRSPAFEKCTGDQFMVSSVHVLNRGCVHHMLDGTISIRDYGEFTLAMFLITLAQSLSHTRSKEIDILGYLNGIMVEAWRDPEAFILKYGPKSSTASRTP
jgi:hypothetical protein